MARNNLDSNFFDGGKFFSRFIKQIIQALDGTLYGRRNGIISRGQNIGDPLTPWGTIYAERMLLGDREVIVAGGSAGAQNNGIVSGRLRYHADPNRSSALPDFIQIGFDSANPFKAKILAADVPLNLRIAGESVELTEDIITDDMTAPPTANNTAGLGVPDLFAANTARSNDSFYGHNGEVDSRYLLGLSNAGSEITDRSGQNITLKYSSRNMFSLVFAELGITLGNVSIVNCVRENFFDKDGNGIKTIGPVATADDTSAELMSTGWLFLGVENGNTISEIVEKSPTISSIAPESPSEGDYWYDSVAEGWKRHSQGSFVEVNRMLVGILVADSTGIIAYRCEDFIRSYNNLNYVQTSFVYEEGKLVALRSGTQEVSVYGNLINLRNAEWRFPEPPDDAPDERETGLDANTWYYMYVADDGRAEISDRRPQYRSDLRGYYHPFESWRCVARTFSDLNSRATLWGLVYLKYLPQGVIPHILGGAQGLFSVIGTKALAQAVLINRGTNKNQLTCQLREGYFNGPPEISIQIPDSLETPTPISSRRQAAPPALTARRTGVTFDVYARGRLRDMATTANALIDKFNSHNHSDTVVSAIPYPRISTSWSISNTSGDDARDGLLSFVSTLSGIARAIATHNHRLEDVVMTPPKAFSTGAVPNTSSSYFPTLQSFLNDIRTYLVAIINAYNAHTHKISSSLNAYNVTSEGFTIDAPNIQSIYIGFNEYITLQRSRRDLDQAHLDNTLK